MICGGLIWFNREMGRQRGETERQRGGVDGITHNVRGCQGVELDTLYGVFNDKEGPYGSH